MLVRKDLSPAYRAVQAGHAVAEFLLTHNGLWKNSYLIYLGVKNETELDKWLYKLRKYPHAVFKEPDINNEKTAFAIMAPDKMFKNLRLLE